VLGRDCPWNGTFNSNWATYQDFVPRAPRTAVISSGAEAAAPPSEPCTFCLRADSERRRGVNSARFCHSQRHKFVSREKGPIYKGPFNLGRIQVSFHCLCKCERPACSNIYSRARTIILIHFATQHIYTLCDAIVRVLSSTYFFSFFSFLGFFY
jgi:hypothetical protein